MINPPTKSFYSFHKKTFAGLLILMWCINKLYVLILVIHNAHNTTTAMVKLWSDFALTKDTHTSPSRARYRVSFMSSSMKTDRYIENAVSRMHCILPVTTHRMFIWVSSRNCGCLVTWFCYQLIAKPGNKTATVPWSDPYHNLKYPGTVCVGCMSFNSNANVITLVRISSVAAPKIVLSKLYFCFTVATPHNPLLCGVGIVSIFKVELLTSPPQICHLSFSQQFSPTTYGSGHETVAVLLPGFAINW